MSNNIFKPMTGQGLAEINRQALRNQWLAENKNALDEYNRRIEMHGTSGDGLRRF